MGWWRPRSAKELQEKIPSVSSSFSYAAAAGGDLPSFLVAAMEREVAEDPRGEMGIFSAYGENLLFFRHTERIYLPWVLF